MDIVITPFCVGWWRKPCKYLFGPCWMGGVLKDTSGCVLTPPAFGQAPRCYGPSPRRRRLACMCSDRHDAGASWAPSLRPPHPGHPSPSPDRTRASRPSGPQGAPTLTCSGPLANCEAVCAGQAGASAGPGSVGRCRTHGGLGLGPSTLATGVGVGAGSSHAVELLSSLDVQSRCPCLQDPQSGTVCKGDGPLLLIHEAS